MNGRFKISLESFEPNPITAAEIKFGSNAQDKVRYSRAELAINNTAVRSVDEYHKFNQLEGNAHDIHTTDTKENRM